MKYGVGNLFYVFETEHLKNLPQNNLKNQNRCDDKNKPLLKVRQLILICQQQIYQPPCISRIQFCLFY